MEVWNFTLPDNPSKTRWAMSSDLYVKHVVRDVECELSNTGQALKTCISALIVQGYQQEINATPELEALRAAYFQVLIGIQWWS